MLTSITIAVSTLLLAASAFCAVQRPMQTSAAWTGKAPVIDGKLDDPAWAETKELGGFTVLNTGGKPQAPTFVKLLTDGKSLFVGFRCVEPQMDKIKVQDRKRDDGTWMDDSVEVNIDPGNERKTVYHLITNAKGSMFDAVCKISGSEHAEEDRKWNGSWEVAASSGSDEWYAEWRIPFETLKITPDTMPCCGVNFARARMGAKVELSSWSPARNQFVNPACLGDLLISLQDRPQCFVSLPGIEGLYRGVHKIDVAVSNLSDSSVRTKLVYQLEGSNSSRQETSPFEVKAGKVGRHPIDFTVDSPGAYRLVLRLEDAGTGKTLYTLARSYDVLPELVMRESLYQLYQGKIDAEVNVNLSSSLKKDAILESRLFKKGSFIPVAQKTSGIGSNATISVNFDLHAMPDGVYTVEANLKNSQRVIASAKSRPMPYSPKSKISFNKDGFMLKEGRPYFPVGIYTLQSKSGDHDAVLEEGRKAGFNTTVFYAYKTNDVLPLLDAAARHDVKAFIYTTNPYRTRNGEASKEEILNDLAARVNHSALLGWYLVDEPEGIGETNVERARNLYQVVKEKDADHPCSLVIMSPGAAAKYGGCADVIWIDPYPVPNRPVTVVGDYVAGAVKAVNNRKPVWVVPQAFDWNIWHTGKVDKIHRPTPEEERCMTYLALVHGAKGVIYWAHTASRYYIRDYPEHWEYVKKLAGELRDLSPVLLTVDSKRKVSLTEKVPIDTMVKELDDSIYLFAVNRETEPCTTAFSISGYGSTGTIEVLFEGRTLNSSSGKFEDKFEPLQVHLYKLSK